MRFKFLAPVAGFVAAITNQYAHASVEQTTVPAVSPSEDAVRGTMRAVLGEQLVRSGDDNYSFVLKRMGSGELMAQHQSHASHASHSSHASHRSGF